MKLNLFRFLALLTVALIFGSTAYSQAVNVRVKVPFDFVLDDRAFPAGEYVVQTVEDGSYALLIRNKDTKTSALTLSYLSRPSKTADQTMLVFQRVGKTYFLSEVWAAGVPVGRQFRMSHAEIRMALNGTKPDTTIVEASIMH
jgi:hypothetical protein